LYRSLLGATELYRPSMAPPYLGANFGDLGDEIKSVILKFCGHPIMFSHHPQNLSIQSRDKKEET